MGKNTIANGKISGPVAKMIELPKHYVINGAVYNKDDTSPVPKSFFMMPTVANESTLKETAYLSEGDNKRIGARTKRSYMVDKKDTSITYLIGSTYNNGNAVATLFKLKETNGVFETIWSVMPSAITYPESFDMVDDDDNYIYVSGHNMEYGHHYIRRYSKKDGTATTIAVTTSSNNKCVEYYPSIINGKIYASISWYATANANSVGAMAVINLADFTVSYVTTPKTDFVTCISQYSQIVRRDNTLVWYGIYISQELWQMTYDIATGRLTNVKVCDIPVPYKTGANAGGYTGDMQVDIRVNKDYIIVSQRTVALNYLTTPITDRTILLFKIAEDSSVTFADSMIVDFPYRNSLLAESDDMLYVFDKFKINVISVTNDRKLLKVSTLTPSYLSMLGRDNVGNVFIISEDTTVSIFNRKIPAIIEVEFENKKGYNFNGKDNILTYMEVKMYNHIGEGVSGVVTVELIGPAVFIDGTRKKSVNIDGSLQIPIIIAGYGEISYSIVND